MNLWSLAAYKAGKKIWMDLNLLVFFDIWIQNV